MIELNTVQRQILRSLTFAEPFSTLVEEVRASPHVISSELKFLIARGLVSPMESALNDRYKPSIYYDSDNMHAFRYQITAKGLNHQEG
jgi:predicted transcriptional regulator